MQFERRNIFDYLNNMIDENDSDEEVIEDVSEDEDNVMEDHETSDSEGRSDEENIDRNDGNYVSADGTVYTPNVDRRAGRRAALNVVRNLHPEIPPNTRFDSILESFLLYYSHDINYIVVRETNREAERVMQLPDCSLYIRDRWYPVTEGEMLAFVGLLIEAGVMRDSGRYLNELFDERRGNPLFRSTMTCERFKQILRFIRFDDKATRPERRLYDKLAAFRQIWNMFVANFRANYVPSAYVTVDEGLVPFRGRAPFKVYMKNKPHKYGIKIWMMSDSESYYCYNAQVYLGQQPGGREVGQGQRVVLDLVQPIEGSGRNVTTDQFFTSFELGQELKEQRLTLVGTMNQRHRDVPHQLRRNRNRALYETLFCHSQGAMLLSYVPKRNKAVVILTTMDDTHETDDDEKQLPIVIKEYNALKCGVDTTNKLLITYHVRRKSNRWTVILFFHSIDISGLNGMIVWIMRNPEWMTTKKKQRRRLYLRELADALVRGHIATRFVDRPLSFRQTINRQRKRLLPIENAGPVAVNPRGDEERLRKRCHLCNQDRRTYQRCQMCRRFVCNEHSRKNVHCNNC